MAELESLKIDLEVKIAREEIQTQILTKDQVKFWLKNMEKLDLASIDNRQRIINTFVNSIYVYEDRFEVNFNCREGFETIPLDIERFVSRLEIVGEPYLCNKIDAHLEKLVFTSFFCVLRVKISGVKP